jgi:hypothetical protein
MPATCSQRVADGAPTTAAYTDCTISAPWWSSYASCPITPIHTERYTGAMLGNQAALATIPWLKLENESGAAIGHLFYGNRPLPVDATFPDGMMAKVLWQTTPPVNNFEMTATSLTDPTLAPVALEDINRADAHDWATYLRIPQPGCWRLDVGGTTDAGAELTWSAVVIVVE